MNTIQLVPREAETRLQVVEAMELLDELDPVDHAKNATSLERSMKFWSRVLLLVGGVALLLALLLAAIKRLSDLPEDWFLCLLVLVAVAYVFALLVLVLEALPELWSVIRFRKSAAAMRRSSLVHDMGAAVELSRFPTHVLKVLKSWLTVYNSRLQTRLEVFFGKPERVAVFSIAVPALALGRNLLAGPGSIRDQFPPMTDSMWQFWSTAAYCLLAGATGLVIGAVMLGRVMRRNCYQLGLIQLAMEIHERRDQARIGRNDSTSGR